MLNCLPLPLANEAGEDENADEEEDEDDVRLNELAGWRDEARLAADNAANPLITPPLSAFLFLLILLLLLFM